MNIELQRALLALSKTVKACADGQIPDSIALTASLQLKELSAQWRPRIDACFLELRQPAPRTTSEKGDAKDALTMACSLLQVMQRCVVLPIASLCNINASRIGGIAT